jgi:hypothetical protein
MTPDDLAALGDETVSDAYSTLDFTETFLSAFAAKDFTAAGRKTLIRALGRLDVDEKHPSLRGQRRGPGRRRRDGLDVDEKHPSLRVHKLEGDRGGAWSASASSSLRMTFERLPGGRKWLLTCSKHDDR